MSGVIGWNAPSNIALVKYWGKIPVQMPANSNISMTLNTCKTSTLLKWKKGSGQKEIILNNKKASLKFEKKILNFLDFLTHEEKFNWLKEIDLTIETSNSFPHSAGIASSASGMAALSLCLAQLEIEVGKCDLETHSPKFFERASFLARLGSGSACRSTWGGYVAWDTKDSGKGTPVTLVHESLKKFGDAILIVDSTPKSVSSSIGHSMMNSHPYKDARFKSAQENFNKVLTYLKTGELDSLIRIVEHESLAIHALMQTDPELPYFLMKPATLTIIEKIWHYRKATGVPFFFSLDAGPNVHMLYPWKYRDEALAFIKSEILDLLEEGKWIDDHTGNGPEPFKVEV